MLHMVLCFVLRLNIYGVMYCIVFEHL